MTRFLTIGSRLGLWYLLTADPRPVNMAIGLAVALLLPSHSGRGLPLGQLAAELGRTLLVIPQAYAEAFRMMRTPHWQERLVDVPATKPVGPVRSRRAPDLLMFLDIFRITFTPLTLVLGISGDDRHYNVHLLEPSQQPAPQEPLEP